MNKDIRIIKEYQKDIYILEYLNNLLSWDRETYMPKDGIESRSEQSVLISGLMHKKIISNELFESIKRLRNSKIKGINKIIVDRLYKKIDKKRKLPEKFVNELSKTTTLATLHWRDAREKNNFKKFEPYLKKIIELKKQEVNYTKLKGHLYNSLLDDFEEGMTTERLIPIFNKLKKSLIFLHKKIEESDIYKKDEIKYNKKFDVNVIKKFCKDVSKEMGLNDNNTRIDTSAHPFMQRVGIDDIRITTNFNHSALSPFMATIHEAGHALYELNLPIKYKYTILYDTPSFGAHESQSKFWEEMIGKNEYFWRYYFSKFNNKFKLNTNFEDWYRYVNKITKNPIRIESDEIAYCLHIILRFELEIGLIDGSIKVKELPDSWNKKMKEYLDIKPKNDSEGVLQDIHWSTGSIGYFPSYAIGVIYSSQLYKALLKSNKDIKNQLEKGNFSGVINWLKDKFHNYGNTLTAEEIIKKTCKEGLNPDVFIKYLKIKYSEIYDL